jgi:hypothetical protein
MPRRPARARIAACLLLASLARAAPIPRRSFFIRFYEGERRPGIDYPWSIALTEENQDDTN